MAGIDFFSLNAKDLYFKNTPIQKVCFGEVQVWPAGGGTTYINLPSTGGTIGYADNWSSISNITASTNSWTVESNDTTWLTVTKYSNTQARYYVTENGVEERTGILSFKIDGVTYATYQVRQMGAAVFIVLTPRLVQLSDGTSRTNTISVSANTTAWTVASTSSWITTEKFVPYSTPMVRYTLAENSGTTKRTGYITVSYGTTNAQTQINQGYGIYVLTGLTTNPVSLSSGQTNFAISIVSKLGDTATTEPSVSIGYNPQLNVQLVSMQSGGTTGQHNYFFYCNSASTTGQTTASIVFTQPNSNKTLTYVVNQSGKANPSHTGTTISGITTYTTNGEWILGYVDTGIYETTGVHTKGIALVYPYEISDEVVAILSMTYQTGPFVSGTSPTSYTLTDEEYTVSAGQTFNVSIDGTTYTFNGRWITYPTPGTQINYLSRFDIT